MNVVNGLRAQRRKDKIFNANDAKDAKKKREEFYPQITQINADCF
jgi:hypothetical protein